MDKKNKMVKKTLIFTSYIGGHQLEYIHHLYSDAITKPEKEFVFAVPERFKTDSTNMQWESYPNVSFIYINGKYLSKVNGNLLKQSFYRSLALKETIKKVKATDVFLIEFIGFLPFLPFIVRNVHVSGIVYAIYLYKWKAQGFFKKFQNILIYELFARFESFETVFILNDQSAARQFNKLYHTNKFKCLPDPYVQINELYIKDMRSSLNIDKNKIIILHPGGMQRRKGTIQIMKAIDSITEEIRDKYAFVFAGQVTNTIKDEFYYYYYKLKENIQIIVFNEFCSFELIGSLCFTCDIILIPYTETHQSSGVLGYAAQFKKRVIVPRGGLVEKLVVNNKLGTVIEDSSYESIKKFLLNPPEWIYQSNDYLKINNVELFNNIIDL